MTWIIKFNPEYHDRIGNKRGGTWIVNPDSETLINYLKKKSKSGYSHLEISQHLIENGHDLNSTAKEFKISKKKAFRISLVTLEFNEDVIHELASKYA